MKVNISTGFSVRNSNNIFDNIVYYINISAVDLFSNCRSLVSTGLSFSRKSVVQMAKWNMVTNTLGLTF